jgi:hypothetical protein
VRTIPRRRIIQQDPSGDSGAAIAHAAQQRRAETARTAATICAQLEPLWIPGGLLELRILESSQGTVPGYFDDPKLLAEAAAPFDGHAQLYVTMNRVNPALPHRLGYAMNRIIVQPKSLTGDMDIARRDWLLVDVDPVREASTSSTNATHQAALDCVEAIRRWLIAQGAPAESLVSADSGNGGHLRVRTDLANDEAALALVSRFLRTIAHRFSTEALRIDMSVGNAARIAKLLGTRACKGPNTRECPHRQSDLLVVPAEVVPVSGAFLHKIAALAPDDPTSPALRPPRTDPYTGPAFDLDAWLLAHAAHLPPMSVWREWRTTDGVGRKRHFRNGCPFGANHASNHGAFIGVRPNGAIVCTCLHDRCDGKDWHLLRDLYESAIVIEV